MIQEIKKELLRLEQQHDIKILYAVESGSRAWGFASINSDWDVRYIYIHRLEWYLKIDLPKDHQEEILANDIDLAGWELKKALRLFRKSNPPLMEWLRSPIVYAEPFSTAQKLRDLGNEYFNPNSCLHHYLHMAEGNYRDYLQLCLTLKRHDRHKTNGKMKDKMPTLQQNQKSCIPTLKAKAMQHICFCPNTRIS